MTHAELSLDSGLLLNGVRVASQVVVSAYRQALNATGRVVDPGPPAPYGHRNNVIHMFDEQGIYLIEHHATGVITQASFVLRAADAPFVPACVYSGSLLIHGVAIAAGVRERDVSALFATVKRFLPGHWYLENEDRSITFELNGPKLPSGNRSRRRLLTYVAIGFSGRTLTRDS